jgi:hypothetical protein
MAIIRNNHRHSIRVSKADVESAVAKTCFIQGSSVHNYTWAVTGANFNAIKSQTAVSITSINGENYTNLISVSCA